MMPQLPNLMFQKDKSACIRKFFEDCRTEKKDPLMVKDAHGRSILFLSVADNNPEALTTCLQEIVQYYGEEKAKDHIAKALDHRGHTPLFIAARSKKTEMIKDLCAAGVDPNVQASSANISSLKTALHEAVDGPVASATIPVLIKHGANPSLPDFYGNNPLHDACYHYKPESIAVMLDYFEDQIQSYNKFNDLDEPQQQILDEISDCMEGMNELGQTPLGALEAKILEMKNQLSVDVPEGSSGRINDAVFKGASPENRIGIQKNALAECEKFVERIHAVSSMLTACSYYQPSRSRSSSGLTSRESESSHGSPGSNPAE